MGRPPVVAVVLTVMLAALDAPAAASVPVKGRVIPAPTVTGPITGGKGTPTLVAAGFDLADVGYTSEEYFLEGTATAYAPKGKVGPDGKWKVKRADRASYKTRMVVYRPQAASDFDGTVFVEWLNVSAGFDSAPDWLSGHTQMIRARAAWIGVSAQSVGVQGGQESVVSDLASGGIKANDPERYATLTHPGDAYSYDIFSQTGVAARNTGEVHPLGALRVKRVIAVGESQSAFRMVTYINAVHPIAHVYDGFLVHSRGASGSGFGTSETLGLEDEGMPETAATRRDIDVPVLTFETESDLTRLGYLQTTERDSKNFRLWEVAGTSHADSYTAGGGFADIDQGDAELALLDPAQITVGPLSCAEPINSGPAFAVLNAALFQLERWVRGGTPPPHAPRIATTTRAPDDPTIPRLHVNIARDEHGIAEGGIRTPLVDAPIAANTGEENSGGSFCEIFGRTVPFDAATLAGLYPTHDDYVRAFGAATDKAVRAGFLLPRDAEQFKDAATSLPIP